MDCTNLALWLVNWCKNEKININDYEFVEILVITLQKAIQVDREETLTPLKTVAQDMVTYLMDDTTDTTGKLMFLTIKLSEQLNKDKEDF